MSASTTRGPRWWVLSSSKIDSITQRWAYRAASSLAGALAGSVMVVRRLLGHTSVSKRFPYIDWEKWRYGMTDDSGGVSMEDLREQERRLVLKVADLPTLTALARRMYEDAVERSFPISISIRAGERLVAHACAPGSTALFDDWAHRKARVVHLFGHSSLLVAMQHKAEDIDFYDKHRLPGHLYAPLGGAFPLQVEGVGLIGSVSVSGLVQLEDHAFVVQHLNQEVSRQCSDCT